MITNRQVTNVEQPDINQVKIFSKYSWYDDNENAGSHPLDSSQVPKFTEMQAMDAPGNPEGKYDWTRAARYGDQNLPMEVGPLAEMLVAYGAGNQEAVKLVNDTLTALGAAGKPEVLMSNLGRVGARVLRAKLNADHAVEWANLLLENYGKGDMNVWTEAAVPSDGEGAGGWNAPRGALAHYMRIEGGRIGAYAAVPPSNWNLSPRDDNDAKGPVEQALIGVPVEDPEKPLEILRTVHTFDP
jgi:Ni,Fe-hydrogenase I large subunit